MVELEHHTRFLAWRLLREFPGTGEVKLLREEPHRGTKTMLVRLPAGGTIQPHTHLAAVQHLILEGSYESQGRPFEVGDYRLLPKGEGVPLICTRKGVTILMMYDPINGTDTSRS